MARDRRGSPRPISLDQRVEIDAEFLDVALRRHGRPVASAQMVSSPSPRHLVTLSTSCFSPLPATILSRRRESQAVPSGKECHWPQLSCAKKSIKFAALRHVDRLIEVRRPPPSPPWSSRLERVKYRSPSRPPRRSMTADRSAAGDDGFQRRALAHAAAVLVEAAP